MPVTDRVQELTRDLEHRPGTDRSHVEQVVSSLGWRVPRDYVPFMASSNGGEGPIGQAGYLVLWPVEQLETMNVAYRVADFAPDLALFGTDGGDTAYAFHQRSGDVVAVPLVGLSVHEAEALGSTFEEFLVRISSDA